MISLARSRRTPIVDRVAIGPVGVTLFSDFEETREEFLSLYPGGDIGRVDHQISIRMELRRLPRSLLGRERYSVIADDRELFPFVSAAATMPYLEWGINRGVIAACRRFLLLHAAAATRGGEATLLVGPSGAGKSTLSAGLIADGWRLFGDEVAMIDPASLQVGPFPKALCVKAGSFPVLKRIGLAPPARRHFVESLDTHVGHVPILPFRSATDAATISRVILPVWTGAESPELRPVSRAYAALILTGQVLNRAAIGTRCTQIVTDLVRKAECFELRHGSIEATLRILRQFD